MLSTPPARAAGAPAWMRPAAMAMASSPEAQRRFTVAAPTESGNCARSTDMRATFMPCSASGMAQPRRTSSISSGVMPPARRSASRSTRAARSSGRVARRVPRGARPTGVRTADTRYASDMNASRMPSAARFLLHDTRQTRDFQRLADGEWGTGWFRQEERAALCRMDPRAGGPHWLCPPDSGYNSAQRSCAARFVSVRRRHDIPVF